MPKLFGKLAMLKPATYLSRYKAVSRNFFSYYPDTVIYIKELKEIASKEESLLNTPDSLRIKDELSFDYWELSWLQLFAKDFSGAIFSAKRGFELNPKNDGVKTNLALGFLLSEQFAEAKSIYQQYKGKPFSNDKTRLFTPSFIADFKELEDKGIISPNNTKIYNRVAEIKMLLSEN